MTFYGKMLASALALGFAGLAVPAAAQQPPAQIKVSSKAQPALIALQNAVNANDTAKIPGAIAAAQAAVQTKEDRYMLGQLQLKAALAAKDDAAISAAGDVIACPAGPAGAHRWRAWTRLCGRGRPQRCLGGRLGRQFRHCDPPLASLADDTDST